jgi:hypothetical protein
MSEEIKLDFQQARMRHIAFKSKLRSVLYGTALDEEPIASQYECGVGKWIYGGAIVRYGHVPEMLELEKVHASIHEVARDLLKLYHAGKVEEARNGLEKINNIAEHLVKLLTTVEEQLN